jgi:hypothetical protein
MQITIIVIHICRIGKLMNDLSHITLNCTSKRQFCKKATISALALFLPACANNKNLNQPSLNNQKALEELISLYTWAYDFGDAEAFADTFTDDGVIIAFGNEEARNRDGIIAFANRLFEVRGELAWQHTVGQHIFQGDNQSCTVYSYYSMLAGDIPARDFEVSSFGYYISDCVNTLEGWRFEKRQIIRGTGNKLPWTV